MIPGATALALAAATLVLCVAALHDIAFRTVPDWASVTLAALGCWLRWSDRSLPAGLACGAAVFGLSALCWRRGWIGGGDVKLLGAGAVLLPPALVPGFIAATSLAGGALALLYLLLEQVVSEPPPRRRATWIGRVLAVERRRISRRLSLPYATAISAGALLMLAKA